MSEFMHARLSTEQVDILYSSWTHLRKYNVSLHEDLEHARSQEDRMVYELMNQIPPVLEDGRVGRERLKKAVNESRAIYSTVQDWTGLLQQWDKPIEDLRERIH
jgi:hypothetical protein